MRPHPFSLALIAISNLSLPVGTLWLGWELPTIFAVMIAEMTIYGLFSIFAFLKDIKKDGNDPISSVAGMLILLVGFPLLICIPLSGIEMHSLWSRVKAGWPALAALAVSNAKSMITALIQKNPDSDKAFYHPVAMNSGRLLVLILTLPVYLLVTRIFKMHHPEYVIAPFFLFKILIEIHVERMVAKG